jgi:hypothetical protein
VGAPTPLQPLGCVFVPVGEVGFDQSVLPLCSPSSLRTPKS